MSLLGKLMDTMRLSPEEEDDDYYLDDDFEEEAPRKGLLDVYKRQFQSFANIAVATGIFPNTGLPLPFISFGSSSLISIFIGMGLVLNVGLQRETRHF